MNQAVSDGAGSSSHDRLDEPDRLPSEIDDDTLRKYFTLTKTDLEQVDQCRGPTNRLGFAVQLCTLRWHGYFLSDTRNIPSPVIEMIGSQLGLLPIAPDNYPQNEKTRFEHLERIRQHLGFARCDAPQRERLLNHLIAIAQGLTRTDSLRQAAQRWLKQERIVRPGRTTLRDLIVSAREAALQNVYAMLSRDLSPRQLEEIDSLLIVAASMPEPAEMETESASRSQLERFKAVARIGWDSSRHAAAPRRLGIPIQCLEFAPFLRSQTKWNRDLLSASRESRDDRRHRRNAR